MGRSQVQKGNKEELAVMKAASEIEVVCLRCGKSGFWYAQKQPWSGANPNFKNDLYLRHPFWREIAFGVEVKVRKSGDATIRKWLDHDVPEFVRHRVNEDKGNGKTGGIVSMRWERMREWMKNCLPICQNCMEVFCASQVDQT